MVYNLWDFLGLILKFLTMSVSGFEGRSILWDLLARYKDDDDDDEDELVKERMFFRCSLEVRCVLVWS